MGQQCHESIEIPALLIEQFADFSDESNALRLHIDEKFDGKVFLNYGGGVVHLTALKVC